VEATPFWRVASTIHCMVGCVAGKPPSVGRVASTVSTALGWTDCQTVLQCSCVGPVGCLIMFIMFVWRRGHAGHAEQDSLLTRLMTRLTIVTTMVTSHIHSRRRRRVEEWRLSGLNESTTQRRYNDSDDSNDQRSNESRIRCCCGCGGCLLTT